MREIWGDLLLGVGSISMRPLIPPVLFFLTVIFVIIPSSPVKFLLDMLREFLDRDCLLIGSWVLMPSLSLPMDRLLTRLADDIAVLIFLSKLAGTPEASRSDLSRLLLDCCLIFFDTFELFVS